MQSTDMEIETKIILYFQKGIIYQKGRKTKNPLEAGFRFLKIQITPEREHQRGKHQRSNRTLCKGQR